MSGSLALLSDPGAYLEELRRLEDRFRGPRGGGAPREGGLSAAELAAEGPELARRLARAVGRGEHELAGVTLRLARIAGKERYLARSGLVDTLVLGVLARVLAELVEPALAPSLHSYRRGRSGGTALRALCAYLDAHRAASSDPRGWGLHVLRRDVRRYGESIQTEDGSALWGELERALGAAGVPGDHPVRRLLPGAFRPRVDSAPPGAPPRIGVPTGSPVQPVAANLYLSALDRELAAIPGGFSARFGDDLLFCHPSWSVAVDASARVARELARLGLEPSPGKQRDLYLTVPGRPPPPGEGGEPAPAVEYLGFRVDLRGRIGLKRDKGRALLRGLRARVDAALGAAGAAAREDRISLAAEVVTRALDPADPLCEPLASRPASGVTDRGQLRALDHAIALAVAERLTRRRGPRAFRDVPYRELRAAGLPSLLRTRDRAGGRRVR